MNFVFISPNFPEAYRWFCVRLKENGVNVLGVGVSQASGALAQFPEGFTMIFGKSPVVIATLMAVLLNLILPKEKA